MRLKFIYLYVFLTGSAVMSVEMAASRLIAPYFGTSLMVWSNIIGIILLAMAGGYATGGRLADQKPSYQLLYLLSWLAGLIITAIPLLSHFIFQLMTNGILATPVHVIILAFGAILLVFAPPVFLLAMVSPFVLRLVSPPAADTGKIAGRLYSFSTLGSLLGTFLPALFLIPQFGTRATLYYAALFLTAISAAGLKRWWAWLFVLLPILLLWFNPHSVKAAGDVLWEKETPYQYVQVIQQQDQSIALVYNEGGGVQSVFRPNGRLKPQDYYDYYLLLPFLHQTEKPQVWILGSAGGTMLSLFDRWVRPAFPGLTLTGVEIDPDVIPLGQKYFGLTSSEGTVVNADARVFLDNRSDKADLVIVDAYSQQIYIPFHLSTVEFFQSIQSHLHTGGVLAINVNALNSSSPLLISFEKTLNSVFAHTYVLPVPESYNFVLLASDQPISSGFAANITGQLRPFAQVFQESMREVRPQQGIILTDDRAPVEFMTDQMIWQSIRQESGGNPWPPGFDQKAFAITAASNDDNRDNNGNKQDKVTVNTSDTQPPAAPQVDQNSMALFEQGRELYFRKQYNQAIDKFNHALNVDANCYPALSLKGTSWAFQGRYDQGIALINQALALYPGYSFGYFNLGLANELAGRWDPAIAAYQEALRLNPTDAWSYYGIASIYGRQGNVDKVLENLQQAIQIDPGIKEFAHEEQDFAPVRSDSRFQQLVGK